MMNIHLIRSAIVVFVSSCVLFGLSSCAEMEAHNTKSLLTSAGFHVKTPETPLQKEIYAALTDRRVERATYKGKTFYVFKDQSEGVAYVGGEAEYQRYKTLAIQQKLAQEYYMAVQMDRMSTYRWYGAYGH